ncbi:hypothetical protein DFJ77DRAFT_458754 [Powellomyces hirtus]|nr:hypothetical protein DFJ77DRAFT_458754 [Powellomyces hirtus]
MTFKLGVWPLSMGFSVTHSCYPGGRPNCIILVLVFLRSYQKTGQSGVDFKQTTPGHNLHVLAVQNGHHLLTAFFCLPVERQGEIHIGGRRGLDRSEFEGSPLSTQKRNHNAKVSSQFLGARSGPDFCNAL